jgi:dipeptidyl aminopeptidase/acylaminoacyl peptidase
MKPEPVRPEDLTQYSLLSEPSVSARGDAVAITVYKANLEANEYEGNVWLVPLEGSAPRKLTSSGKDGAPKLSPDGKDVVFTSKRGIKKGTKGNALYLVDVKSGDVKFLLKRKRAIESPAWFPDGKRILFVSAVGKAQDDVKTIKRINVWFNDKGFVYNVRRHAFVFDFATGKAKQVTRGEFDVDKAAVSHSGTKVAFTASTDDVRPYLTDVFVLDLNGGGTIKLTGHDMEISSVAWSPDDRRLVFLGHRRTLGSVTHEHLWVMGASGGKPKQLDHIDRSKTNSLNSDVRKGGLNAEPKWVGDDIFFLVNDHGAVHIYSLDPIRKTVRQLVGGDRSIEAFEVNGDRLFFTSMESTKLPDLYVYDGRIGDVTRFNEDVKRTLNLREPERFSFKASDGERIDGWVIRPAERGKVPTILYIHGGPKTAFGCAYLHEFQVFAARGYAVLYVNPRGSDSYTEKFADIRGHYAERDYLDLMEAVDYAASHFDFVDSNRIGVAGGSYGGYMTNWMVTQTNRFKAAVSDRSISNWWTFWGTSDIGPYFMKDQIGCDPWDDEETTMAKSPIRYVKNVKTPIMFVHSMEDYRCWMVEALQMFTALKYHGKETELVLFPGENHELSRGGKPKHRVLRLESYLRWFDLHLKK